MRTRARIRPRGTAWLPVVQTVVVGFFGPVLQLPGWALRLSPFPSVPRLPVEPFTPAPVVVLSVLATLLGVLGLAAFRRRDLT